GQGGLERPCGTANQIIRAKALRARRVPPFHIDVRKERNHWYPKGFGLFRVPQRLIDAETLHARHGGHLHALAGALDEEDRPDEVVCADPVLANQTPAPPRLSGPAQPYVRKTRNFLGVRWNHNALPILSPGFAV